MTGSSDEDWGQVTSPLGELLIHFNRMEVELGSTIAYLLKQKSYDVGSIFSAVLSFSQKVTLFDMLLDVIPLPASLAKQCRDVIEEARRINAFRNRAVHSEYRLYEDPTPDQRHLWRKHGDAPEPVEGFEGVHVPAYYMFNAADIAKAAADAQVLASRLELLQPGIEKAMRGSSL